MIECIFAREQGFSHKREGRPCQDAVFAASSKSKSYAIICVADGHGGERYFRSGTGAKFAVEIAKEKMWQMTKELKMLKERKDDCLEKTIKSLEQNIVSEWQRKAENDFRENHLSEEEKIICEKMKINFEISEEEKNNAALYEIEPRNYEIIKCYGTTLLCALYIPARKFPHKKKSLWVALQIGDGLTFALKEDGQEFFPIEADERLGFGVTTSLCSKNAASDFRHNFGYEKFLAFTVCTDGVSDSFEKDKFGAFVKKIHAGINEKGAAQTQKELQEFFPRLSEQGSGDDLGLAGVFWVEGK